jgi:hypothetical protein
VASGSYVPPCITHRRFRIREVRVGERLLVVKLELELELELEIELEIELEFELEREYWW